MKNKDIDKKLLKERKIIHERMLKKATEEMKQVKTAPEGYMVSLHNINKIYPNHVQAVYDFNLDIKEKEFIVLVGPSGCGKSTTLRMIAGLESITYGDLFIDGKYANSIPPKNRDIAMVFQNYALYPNMSVYENMAFGLQVRHISKEEIKKSVLSAADSLGLTDYLSRKPSALSGGQKQRVALGRAIVRNANVFLMDEPLSNLDAQLRAQMRAEIVRIHRRVNATTVYVTHDQVEAMSMADRIVIMNKGRIQQIGTPKDIYEKPSNVFVATFIGTPSMNILEGKIDDNIVTLKNGFKIELSKKQAKSCHDFYHNQINSLKNDINDLVKKLGEIKSSIVDDKKIAKEVEEEIFINEQIIAEKNSLLEKYESFNSNSSKNILLGIRPENIYLTDANIKHPSKVLKLDISLSELLGNQYYLHSSIGEKEIIAALGSENNLENVKNIKVVFDLDRINLFDPLSKERFN